MTTAIVAQYNQVPRMRTIVGKKIIYPVGGSNPADLGNVELPNVRGQVKITIISGDNSFMSMFDITGGFGDWPGQYTQNWWPQPTSAVNCTIRTLQTNRIEVTTPPADAGGRVYIFNFFPYQSIAPTVRQNSVNIIGNNTLTVSLNKEILQQGF